MMKWMKSENNRMTKFVKMFFKQVLCRVVFGAIYRKNLCLFLSKEVNRNNFKFQHVKCAYLSNWHSGFSPTDKLNKESTSKGGDPKKVTGPKITLIGTDDSISVVSLEDGQKIAKRRNLKFVKMVEYDTKAQRPVYKLMNHAEYNEQYLKEKKSSKVHSKREKLLTVSSRIDKHDLESKVKMIEKWLTKDYEVRVVINGDETDMSVAERVYKTLEDYLEGKSRFLQKRLVNADIKFHIKGLPVNKTKVEPEISEIR